MNAEAVVLAFCAVLLGDPKRSTDRGLMSHTVNGSRHLPTCPRGQWLTPGGPRPDGDPCSWRCLAAQDAVSQAAAWLREHETTATPRQAGFWEAVG